MTALIMTMVLFLTIVCFMRFTLGKPNEWDPLKTNRDWVSSEIIFDATFLNVINDIKTVETVNGNGPVVLDDIDKRVLKKRCKADLDCIQTKSLSIKKYKTKMEALQCVNAVIVHFILNMAEANIEQIDSKETFEDSGYYVRTNMILTRMLSLLFSSKIVAHNWLWTIYIQFHSKFNWPYMFLPEHNSYYLHHGNELLRYIKSCQINNYLSIDDDRPSTPKAYYDSILKMDINQYIDQLYGINHIKKLRFFFYVGVFWLDNFVLSDFFNRDTDLFDPFPKGNIFWGSSKELVRKEKDTLNAVYHTLEWIKEPFKYIEYHNRVLIVIKMNAYFYAWSHMKLFESTLSQAKNHIDEINFKVENTTIWKLPCVALRVIMQLFHDYGDPVLFSITNQLCSDVNEFNGEFLEKLRHMTKTAKEIISNVLKEIGIDDNDVDATFFVDDKPETKENIYHDLIQMGANENHVRGILYDDVDTLKDLESEFKERLSIASSSSEPKDKELLSLENDEVIITLPIIIQSKIYTDNKIVKRANRFLRYTVNLCFKLIPINVYFIVFFYKGKGNINETFFYNTGVHLASTSE